MKKTSTTHTVSSEKETVVRPLAPKAETLFAIMQFARAYTFEKQLPVELGGLILN